MWFDSTQIQLNIYLHFWFRFYFVLLWICCRFSNKEGLVQQQVKDSFFHLQRFKNKSINKSRILDSQSRFWLWKRNKHLMDEILFFFGSGFLEGRNGDVINAWTCSSNVRRQLNEALQITPLLPPTYRDARILMHNNNNRLHSHRNNSQRQNAPGKSLAKSRVAALLMNFPSCICAIWNKY